MNEYSSKSFYYGLFCVFLFALISFSGSLTWINAKITDQIQSYTKPLTVTFDSFIIHNDIPFNEDYSLKLDQLIEELYTNGVRDIVLLTQSEYSIPHVKTLSRPINVAVPMSLIKSDVGHHNVIESYELYSIDGLYRQYSLPKNKGLSTLTLEGEQQPFETNKDSTVKRQWLNGFLTVDQIPNLSMTQALSGNLIQSLVVDKLVIIDLDERSVFDRFYLPNYAQPASYSEVQALVLETDRHQLAFHQMPMWQTLLIMIALFVLNYVLLQLMSPKMTSLFFLLMVSLLIAVTWLVNRYAFVFFPIVECFVIQLFSLLYFLSVERFREGALVSQMTAEINARVSMKVSAPSFYQSEQPWTKLHTLINQQIRMRRSIFLEKIPNDHRLNAIDSLNCSIEDISERRRDFERKPYSIAIADQKPLLIENGHYFNQVNDDEAEYITPLIFAGNVLGFWALTVDRSLLTDREVFEIHLASFSRELSELLYHRTKFLEFNQEKTDPLKQFLRLQVAEKEYQTLNATVSILERRFDILQDVFNGMSSAALLYDLFGQIMFSNKKVDELSTQFNVSVFNLTAHDLLIELTGEDSAQVKQSLLQVTLQGSSIDFQLAHQIGATDYLLRVRPVKVEDSEENEGAPFLLLGILFEFIDISPVQRIIERKKDLYEQHFHQMRNNLSTLHLYCRQLRDQVSDEGKEFLSELESTLDDTVQLNSVVEKKLKNYQTHGGALQAVNAVNMWQRTASQFQSQLNKKSIRLLTTLPNIVSLVTAPPEMLKRVFELILDLLINDSINHDAELSLNVIDSEQASAERVMIFRWENQGYGVPKSQLEHLSANHKVLSNSQYDSDVDHLSQLLSLSPDLENWFAKLFIDSELGKGFMIELVLPVFDTKTYAKQHL